MISTVQTRAAKSSGLHHVESASVTRRWLAVALLLAVIPSSGCHSGGAAVGADTGFTVQTIHGDLLFAESLVLEMLDTEGLYTICGGLKPISCGFWRYEFDAAAPDVQPIERTRATLQTALQLAGCDQRYYADVQVFSNDAGGGRRCAEAVIVDRRALADTIDKYAQFFHPLGITRGSHPMEVLTAVDALPPPDQCRAYGYLFGYPAYAVDFFVNATERERRTGRFVERDFLSVPTFRRSESQFVWAVPRGHRENEADLAIRSRAAEALADYREQRLRLLQSSKAGCLELLRELVNGEPHHSAASFDIEDRSVSRSAAQASHSAAEGTFPPSRADRNAHKLRDTPRHYVR